MRNHIAALTAALSTCFVGQACAAGGGPGSREVGQVCQAMTAATPIVYLWYVGGAEVNGNPALDYLGTKIDGTSVDSRSNTAIVKAECFVRFRGESNVMISTNVSGGGFSRWIQYNDRQNPVQNGEQFDFAVEMSFRKYDTGWSFERLAR
ncbi:MAG: hypothetical protein ISS15_06760 [Alphaproteobacteria bacterium]|nr:hypothetical protein [Alphaproteobacteria bacterium]MBL7097338.1 hypothetical protein [Alphaproteobacteria bacterium]